jgi:hypothetical protein
MNGMVQFNAQGTFLMGTNQQLRTFQDVTNSSLWLTITPNASFPGKVSYAGNGQFIGVTAGCTCIAAVDGGLQSQTVLIGVDTPVVSCTPCPQLPTPSPTP